jgi:AcrR family transcriptional regulator
MTASHQRSGARERKKRDKRERLRKAAWELFNTVGYEHTTTLAIAQRAGVAAGTVFLYAKDKPDLLFIAIEHRLASAIDAAFSTMPADVTLPDQLRHLFSRLLEEYEQAPQVGRQFVRELPGADGPNARRVNDLTIRFLHQLAEVIEAAQQRGEVRPDVAPLLAAQSAFAHYFMALFIWLDGVTDLRGARDEFLQPSIDLLMHGLATPGPRQ